MRLARPATAAKLALAGVLLVPTAFLGWLYLQPFYRIDGFESRTVGTLEIPVDISTWTLAVLVIVITVLLLSSYRGAR